jgi:hypothetical protein
MTRAVCVVNGEGLLEDLQRLAEERLGFVVSAEVTQQHRVVIQRGSQGELGVGGNRFCSPQPDQLAVYGF